jgi:ABC-type Fe3+-hydroxamate transport system substrate-binding protein
MKKVFLLSILAAFAVAGCATTGTEADASSMQIMTLDEALQKAAETRAQLQQAKDSYQKAKTVADVASGNKSLTDSMQDQIQKQVNSAKNSLKSERDAWAELLK